MLHFASWGDPSVLVDSFLKGKTIKKEEDFNIVAASDVKLYAFGVKIKGKPLVSLSFVSS